jgi:hypothetical protein
MKCYRLEKNKAIKGLPTSAFPIDNAETKGDIILEASVSMIIPKEIDVGIFHSEIENDNTSCYQFGEVWLRKPRKKRKNSGEILLSFDWADYWPDKNLGDVSTLLTWNDTYALYSCKPTQTYIRDRNTGDIFTLEKRVLTSIQASEYDQLRKAQDRKLTVQSVKDNNVLLDYLID